MEFISRSEQETFGFAKALASRLRGGEVLALIGDLGAGKTVFARGLAAGLGVKENVNSPTFVLMKVYRVKDRLGVRQFVHIDAYRLESGAELKQIGVEDFLGKQDTVVLIEWADRVKEILPQKAITIKIKADEEKREISMSASQI